MAPQAVRKALGGSEEWRNDPNGREKTSLASDRPEEENEGSFISGPRRIVTGMAVAVADCSLTGEKAPSNLS